MFVKVLEEIRHAVNLFLLVHCDTADTCASDETTHTYSSATQAKKGDTHLKPRRMQHLHTTPRSSAATLGESCPRPSSARITNTINTQYTRQIRARKTAHKPPTPTHAYHTHLHPLQPLSTALIPRYLLAFRKYL